MGRFYVAIGDEAATTVTTGGTHYKVAGTTTAGHLSQFTHSNGRLTYTGPRRWFNILAVATITVNLSGGIVHLRIAKNGTETADSEQHQKVTAAGDKGNMSVFADLELGPGDYIEVFCTTDVGQDAKEITAEHLALIVR